jgi:hypothetical protein
LNGRFLKQLGYQYSIAGKGDGTGRSDIPFFAKHK